MTSAALPASRPLPLYLAVGLLAGAVIAVQVFVMRVFAVGSWVHFGSLVVAMAMLGFGLASGVMALSKPFFERRWRGFAGTCLVLFGPVLVACHLVAQQVPINPIFIVSDPAQKWYFLAVFLLYFLPFLVAAFFLGTVFLKSAASFGRVYFADLIGAGLAGLLTLGAMYLFAPAHLVLVPVALWLLAGIAWFTWTPSPRGLAALAVAGAAALLGQLAAPSWFDLRTLAVSDYKGIAYAQKFPDSRLVYRGVSPFGDLAVYSSSYLHFAPGLSDNAAFNLTEFPANAYLGMYIDGDGPNGIMADLPPEQTSYFDFLPHNYPYLLNENPDTFVVQFGGGISTLVALNAGASHVTVAEANPAVIDAFADPAIRAFTGDVLNDPRVEVVPVEGRLELAHTEHRYDVIELSLADSVGLSSPGGFAIVEKYAYTREAMRTYMAALAPGGVLAVTVWNKEEPPKSVLKVYATMAEAAREAGAGDISDNFFVVSSFLSTATILYKQGGFTPEEIALLRDHTRRLSFDEIYAPGFAFEPQPGLFEEYRNGIFGGAEDPVLGAAAAAADPLLDPTLDPTLAAGLDATLDPTLDPALAGTDPLLTPAASAAPQVLPSTAIGRMAWAALVADDWLSFSDSYLFDVSPLTNDRPYFAAYVRPGDLSKTLDRLDLFQDDWGSLVIWATLGIAGATALVLLLLPVLFGWRTIFSRQPGKWGALVYFACLGFGYIVVEVGLIAKFVLALSIPTISATALISGMLVFSGLGSLLSERLLPTARTSMPFLFGGIAVILAGYAFFIDPVLDTIGTLPYALRLLAAVVLVAPPAFLMGMPMPVAMTSLDRLGKEHLFVWAWGVNGCFSVVGSAAVPILSTAFGLGWVLLAAAAVYLVAGLGFFSVLKPRRTAMRLAAAPI